MSLRRGLISLVITGLVLPLMLAGSAAAQLQMNTYPGGPVNINNTTVTVANTAVGTSLYSFVVPARLFQNLRQPLAGAAALHLMLMGRITTNQGVGSTGNINVGCNYGGANASIALVNAQTPFASLVNSPWYMDVWLRTQGTSTTSEFLMGQLVIANTQVQNASQATFNAATLGTVSITSNQTLTCIWQWGSAATTNSITVNSAILEVAN